MSDNGATKQLEIPDLTMLHYIKLPEPRLIKGIAGRVYDVTETVLLRDNEHRVQEAFHGVRRANQCWAIAQWSVEIHENKTDNVQFVGLVDEEHGHLLHRRGRVPVRLLM